ncbi:hypothetical protein Rhsp01_57950 [Rhizobium sp. NBRC 114257]|uniref:Uncharacterized protein n=1 Tax=Rhizobium dioscoreae TaxID=2653122 RepID=A0ABQ0ZCA6_9HYPH|nr:hypothetical protein RsS93_57540 [Rhizobium dioscoreae]GLU84619.1 hypothetical protein Rhsp01_57950 [Rhizobium sp. NBRC 114257]
MKAFTKTRLTGPGLESSPKRRIDKIDAATKTMAEIRRIISIYPCCLMGASRGDCVSKCAYIRAIADHFVVQVSCESNFNRNSQKI